MRDVRQLRVPWPDYEISAPAAPFPVDAIPPPLSYPDPVYVRIPDRGTALVSDAIDRFLVQSGVASELAREPYRLPGPLQASAPYVLAACNAGRVVFYGDVVGMRGDPLTPRARGGCGTPDRAGPAPADPGGGGAAAAPRRARGRLVASQNRSRGSCPAVSRGLAELPGPGRLLPLPPHRMDPDDPAERRGPRSRGSATPAGGLIPHRSPASWCRWACARG